MAVNLKGRSFLTLMDFTPAEIRYLLDLAHDLKAKKRLGITGNSLEGKNIVLLFEKTSTRTRCSFEVAAMDEGAGVTFLDSKSSQMGKKESIADTAKVLGRIFDGIEYRGYEQLVVEELAAESGVPVWNGLTDIDHPTQILADLLTVKETFGSLADTAVAYVGDGRNNVANSLMVTCAKVGMDFVACGPAEQMPDARLVEKARMIATETGGKYFRATNNTKLMEIYSEINQMEKTRTTVDSFPVYSELFMRFALIALLALLAELLLRFVILRRIP